MYRSLLVVLFSVVLSKSNALKYTDCGSKTGEILDIQITGCEDNDVCEFKRGETYNFEMSFKSLTDSKNLRAVLHGIISGVSMPFPLQNSNACDHSDIQCPLQNGNVYNYAYQIEVRNSYPAVRADVKWELRDDKNQDVICALLPLKIV